MNQKQIGYILIILGILSLTLLYSYKAREDQYIRYVMQSNQGSCFLDDGTCLHADRSFTIYVLWGTVSASLVLFGIYLAFIDKTQKTLFEHQVKVSKALEEAKKHDKEKDEFKAFLSAFTNDEQLTLKAIKEQDGILQSTLSYRTGIPKTTLSLTLQSLELRGVISRKEERNTKKVFLKKKF